MLLKNEHEKWSNVFIYTYISRNANSTLEYSSEGFLPPPPHPSPPLEPSVSRHPSSLLETSNLFLGASFLEPFFLEPSFLGTSFLEASFLEASFLYASFLDEKIIAGRICP